ncbi:MAG TPA: hypothetical protein VMW48_05210 [Vicinamibacterales bacterium]|nr:hypothetical protein [Vicinamibacterales bacterium]
MNETAEQQAARRRARNALSQAVHHAHAAGVSWASMDDLLRETRAHYEKVWTIDEIVANNPGLRRKSS